MAEETGFMEKITSSIKGVLIGFLLIPLSFVIVYFASQREQASEVLEGAMPFEKAAEAASKKKAVFMTGQIQSTPIGDGEFLKPGPYLTIHRKAEMYAYVTKEEKKEVEKNGKKEKVTVYKCVEEWVSSSSKDMGGKGCTDERKYNPTPTLRDYDTSTTPSLVFQGKTWAMANSVSYTGMPDIKVSEDKLMKPLTVKGSYIFPDASCASGNKIGCERLSFSGTSYDPAGEYTAVGTPDNGRIEGFKAKSGDTYLRLGPGKYESVMKSLNKSDSTMTIILFVGSVICLGLGMSLVVGPFLELIEFIPLVGNFGAGLIRVFLFGVAFVVMGISFLLIEYWYLVLLLFVVAVVAAIMIAKKRKAATA